MTMKKEKLIQEWLNNFNTKAFITYESKKYRITEKELRSIYSTLNYWHHKTDPSSWLCEALVRMAKWKYSSRLPRALVISLCAQLLNITPGKLESSLDWNANYIAWHDGGTPDYHHVWKKKE